jgi:hypothetical protein
MFGIFIAFFLLNFFLNTARTELRKKNCKCAYNTMFQNYILHHNITNAVRYGTHIFFCQSRKKRRKKRKEKQIFLFLFLLLSHKIIYNCLTSPR